MIDILYLAHGREEFTAASVAALVANTNWELVGKAKCHGDGLGGSSVNRLMRAIPSGVDASFRMDRFGGPVAIMNYELHFSSGAEFIVKIDNDVILPPGWLDAALFVMQSHPALDILGLEPPASRTPAPWSSSLAHDWRRAPEFTDPMHVTLCGHGISHIRGYVKVSCVGGVFIARRSAFTSRRPMVPCAENGVGGFTSWQTEHPDLNIGWITPPLKLFLLDRLPFDPWASLSKRYIAEGVQRAWTNYDSKDVDELWGWWKR